MMTVWRVDLEGKLNGVKWAWKKEANARTCDYLVHLRWNWPGRSYILSKSSPRSSRFCVSRKHFHCVLCIFMCFKLQSVKILEQWKSVNSFYLQAMWEQSHWRQQRSSEITCSISCNTITLSCWAVRNFVLFGSSCGEETTDFGVQLFFQEWWIHFKM